MKIAIVGGGISGLSLGYLINDIADITIFEKNDYIGGHSRTIDLNIDNQNISVDTGFIVFNKKNYPNLTAFFDHLNVKYEKSNMSFGVSIANGEIEYSTKSVDSFFAQRKNIFNINFLTMIWDIFSFYRNSQQIIKENPYINLSSMLDMLGLDKWFRNYFLLPMAGSIWSSNAKQIENFSAKYLIDFFNNHGLLSFNDQPIWQTVTGGSKQYIHKLTKVLKNKIYKSVAIEKVMRNKDGVILEDDTTKRYNFDQVVFACHSDQAIKILARPSVEEVASIGEIKYNQNNIVVHSDSSLMPINRKCWSSWVYRCNDKNNIEEKLSLTYWMNNLQNINTKTQIFVTVNPFLEINEAKIFDRYKFEHPLFDMNTDFAQRTIEKIQGENNTWFVGAYNGYGFHEDGLNSSIKIAKQMGAKIPW